MRTLEGIDTFINFSFNTLAIMLEDMRTLEGIDTSSSELIHFGLSVRRYENP